MTSRQDPKDDIVFLGINFNNFFKNCGCIQRFIHNDSESESSFGGDKAHLIKTEKRKKFGANDDIEEPPANNINEEARSVASSTDWTDLEEVPIPNDPLAAGIFHPDSEMNIASSGNINEEFYTQEPIDFDYLKQVTEVNKEEDDGDSVKSGLSRNSKKISKENPAMAEHKAKAKNSQKENYVKGKRRPWQPHEDAQVLELVAKYGQSWAVVASMMEGRTGKQIRDRYLNKLRPNIKKGEWTQEEDRFLLSLYYQIGHKWSKIATQLPGRTEGQVKNRFYSHIKKKILGLESDQTSTNLEESPESNVGSLYQGDGKMKQEDNKVTAPMEMFQEYGRQGHYVPISSGPEFKFQEDYMKGMQSPSLSIDSASTQNSKISSDKDINNILDLVTNYLDKKPGTQTGTGEKTFDFEKMSVEDRVSYLESMDSNSNVGRLGRLEQLQERRRKLEMLLAKTVEDMGIVNPQSDENGLQMI